MEPFDNYPPKWAMAFFRFLIHPEFQEEIEGDLLERYLSDVQKYGLNRARMRFYKELFSVVKPNLILNLNQITMNFRNWSVFLLISFAVALASISPFLPGPRNVISHVISQFTQTIGYFGLAFVPFGAVWLFIEIRNKKEQKLNLWTNGYYLSWLTITPIFLFISLQFGMAIHEGWTFQWSNLLPLTILVSVLAFIIFNIQKLKRKTVYKFNTAPFYIVFLPLVTVVNSWLVVENAACFRREEAIEKTQPLIAAIEEYKTDTGKYPEKLNDLEGRYIREVPRFNIMGIKGYQYEIRNDAYLLSFEQFWHWNATEVVFYSKSDQLYTKGYYKNYPTKYANWKYYFAD